MKRDPWWHVQPVWWGPIAVFQVLLGTILFIALAPVALFAAWKDGRR